MTEDRKRPAARELAGIFAKSLRSTDSGRTSELAESLGWLFAEKTERGARTEDFEAVNARINQLIESPDAIPAKLRDVSKLADLLSGNPIPSLEEARKSFYQNPEFKEVVTATIQKATREYASWARVNWGYPSLGTPSSGALIEGFGAFLQSLHGKEGLNRAYVLAFEEVLVSERQNSPLTKDVIGWMVEEKSTFPQELHQTIDTLSQKYYVLASSEKTS